MWARREAELFDYSPDTLLNICLHYVAVHKNTIMKTETWDLRYKLKDDVVIPAGICEKLLETFQKYDRLTDCQANLFRDKFKTKLGSIKLWNARITDEALRWLMEHKPYRLDLVQCENLTPDCLDIINKNSENLISLRLGSMPSILPKEEAILRPIRNIIYGPKIRKFVLQRKNLIVPTLLILRPVSQLTHLDLSECSSGAGIWALNNIKQLVSFVLHNVEWVLDIVDWICTLTSLRHLDISQVNESYGQFMLPNEVLRKIVTSLPNLESLDISGTNLAGSGAATVASVSQTSSLLRCDIPGLVSRVNKPLKFLGLYGTSHGACKRHDIPAEVITGDANEEQIFNAAVVYLSRPNILTRVLNDLYYLFRYDINANITRALSVVLEAMHEHVSEKHIQISGSATLFYIVKGKETADIPIGIRRRIIRALLDGMETHIDDDTMMRNGCLTLCQFKIPNDVLFEYERVVLILLHGVADANQEGFVQRIAIYLLNSLACQVDGKQKQYLGNLGAIS
ncbi:Protein zer-1 homolog, partial [Eumeta japonica]